jgi:hypothetical protein
VKWGAVALGPFERVDERGDAVGRAALLELVERCARRLAELVACGGSPELPRQRAGVAAADLGERAARSEAGGDGRRAGGPARRAARRRSPAVCASRGA